MTEPLVSILIPTYNPNPEHLRAALKSVLAQTEDRWTLLIHDDASSFDVREHIGIALEDSRITFLRSKNRLGIGGNWNACLKHKGSAPYVQFLFQDDTWDPEYVERATKTLEAHADIDFVVVDHAYAFENMGEVQPFYDALLRERRAVAPGRHDGREFLREWLRRGIHPNLIGEPSFVMMCRSFVERVGLFREDMPQCLDAEYWTRCCMKGNFSYINENLGSFRVHKSAASAQNEQAGAGIYDRFRCFQLIIEALPPGELRHEAIDARNAALDTMVKKFFGRVRGGKRVSTKGGGSLLPFALRHPLLVLGTVLRQIRTR
ncbi:glycosyltransferase [Candidatus Peregrinibacteria bacterium]|nr:glycosyltransferase [Candidatus Peregrinibacteria bacterium]